jgi:hypothetical protein
MTGASSLVGESEPTVKSELSAMLDGYRIAASSTADLAAAELRVAASTTVLLLVLGIAVAVLAISSWLLAMLAVAALLVEAPRWPLALAGISAANLLVALACWLWMKSMTRHLTFRQLRDLLAGRTVAGAPAEQDQ